MKFDVECVRNYLLRNGEVFTVRKWKSKSKFRVIDFEGRGYMVERIKAVSGRRSILKYVRSSGFDNVDAWWSAIKKFDAMRGQLYHVTLLEDEVAVQEVLPGCNDVLAHELGECDNFRTEMSNKEYANARLYYQSDDEQEA